MSLFLVVALYLFARRTKPQWSPWILRGTVVACLVVPQWNIPEGYLLPLIVAGLIGGLLGYLYRDTKSASV
jgi:hypothetical protein